MNWDDLRFLLAVARHRRLTEAARILNVNHSTVSRRLAALADDTGTRLFEKLPDGYVPTAAGETLIGVAERMEAQLQTLDRHILGQDASLSGPLRVTTLDLIGERHITLFHRFLQRYPAVELEITIDNAPISLTKREADIAIRATNAPPEHLTGRRLLTYEYAIYGARSLIDANEDKGLPELPWIAWDQKLGARLTERWMRKNVPNAYIACRVDSSTFRDRALREGVGIAFYPCLYGDRDPDLVRLSENEPGFELELWVLTHPDLRHTARVRAFIDMSVSHFQEFAAESVPRHTPT